MKQVSKDTANVIGTLEGYAKSGLRKKNDLELIFEFCAETGNIELLRDLVLHGTALRNVSLKLTDPSLPEDSKVLIQAEFQNQLEIMTKLIGNIKESGWDEEFSGRIDQIYLEKTKGGVMNIVDLSNDLYLFKQMQNEHQNSKN